MSRQGWKQASRPSPRWGEGRDEWGYDEGLYAVYTPASSSINCSNRMTFTLGKGIFSNTRK